MTKESKQEKWEIEFDEHFNVQKYEQDGLNHEGFSVWQGAPTAKDIKSFIRTTLTTQKEETMEMCEEMKKVDNYDKYCGCDGECFASCPASYNQALDDLKRRLEEVK